jgi:hypothetical protein
MFRGNIYVPKDRDLRRRIVKQHHDTRITGHAGRFKTLELIACNYWWPQMSRYISIYVKQCDLCNQTKVQRQRPISELHPSETPEAPWETISVDFIVELPESHGYNAIMCVVDRGPQFIAAFTRELYRCLGIKLALSTAYHPQTDGQTEHVNQVIEGYLRAFTSQRQDDWDNPLPSGEFHYNNSRHSSTQQTPFMLDTGRNPRMGFEPHQPPWSRSMNSWITWCWE